MAVRLADGDFDRDYAHGDNGTVAMAGFGWRHGSQYPFGLRAFTAHNRHPES